MMMTMVFMKMDWRCANVTLQSLNGIQACSNLRKSTFYPGAALSYPARDVLQRQKNSLVCLWNLQYGNCLSLQLWNLIIQVHIVWQSPVAQRETLITVIHPRALQDRRSSSQIIMAQEFHLSLRILAATLLFLDSYVRVSSQRLKEEPALTSHQHLVRGTQTKLRNMDHMLTTPLQTSTVWTRYTVKQWFLEFT